ncbi:MAG: TIR domain-containing protein [bacterium]|nr:TIR domain-containing protein [bacterium]
MTKIFIAYRREDAAFPAKIIHDRLEQRFGPESVVLDVDAIPLGKDYRKFLHDAVTKCDVLLALIGGLWLETIQQRQRDDNDFVRIEIEAALSRNILVVPVMVDGTEMPHVDDVPPQISELVYRHSAALNSGATIEADLKALVSGLERALGLPAPEPSPGTPPASGAPGAPESPPGPEASAEEPPLGTPGTPEGAETQRPNLVIRLSVNPRTGGVGEDFRWTMTVRNSGESEIEKITARAGNSILADPFSLEPGRWRRFTFTSKYTAVGKKRRSVSATIPTPGGPLRVGTRANVLVE